MTVSRTISQTFKVGSTPTNVTSAKLSDPTGTFGIKRNDTSAVVVADATNMTNSATGVYEYTFDAEVNIAYTAYIEFVYDGDTIYIEFDLPAVSDDFGMVTSYNSLMERVGHYLFGIRSGFSSDQTDDIEDCIHDGLHDVYTAHQWSFFRPVEDISTTAPYATGTVTIAAGVVTLTGGTFPSWAADGILKVSNSYYSIASRDGNTQITLDDTSVTVAAASAFQLGRPEIELSSSFEAISGDSDLTYYPDQNDLYPPVRQRHDRQIRTWQQDDPYYDRPIYYSVRTVEFDPTTGSRKRLALYPTPDAAYVLRVPMILRPTMIDSTNQYPVGGETLAQVILEACLAAAERNYDEENKRHTERFGQLLPLAIRADMEKSAPTSLGPDMPKGERGRGLYDDYWLRSSRIATLTLDGDSL
jgi:hypothetical protein